MIHVAVRLVAYAMTSAMLAGSIAVTIWAIRNFPDDPEWDR